MNLTGIEWSLSGFHLVNFQGGRQAEFKSSKLVDDKLILLSVSLPRGDQNKHWNGSWEESGESLRDVTVRGGNSTKGKKWEGTNKDLIHVFIWLGGGKVNKCDFCLIDLKHCVTVQHCVDERALQQHWWG